MAEKWREKCTVYLLLTRALRCFRSYHQFCRVEKNRCRVWARGRPPGPQAALGGGLPLALTLACRCRVWARGRSPGPQPAVAATLKYFDLLHLHCMAVAPAPDLTVGQVTTLYDLYLTWFMQTDQFPRGKSGYGQVHNSMISSIPAIFNFSNLFEDFKVLLFIISHVYSS